MKKILIFIGLFVCMFVNGQIDSISNSESGLSTRNKLNRGLDTLNNYAAYKSEVNNQISDSLDNEANRARTLTNKTIDADNNTITNIGDSEMTTGINANKVADGTVSNTEYQYINSVSSNVQTQLGTKASLTGAEALTNKTIDADNNTITNIGASELSNTAVTPGSYTNTDLTVDADGRITAASDGTGGSGGGDSTWTDASVTNRLDIGDSTVYATGAQLFLPEGGAATTPSLMFGNNGAGLRYASSALSFNISTSTIFNLFSSGLEGAGQGPSVRYADATNILPTLCPDKSDVNTGIGQKAEDELSLIAGGIEGIRISELVEDSISMFMNVSAIGFYMKADSFIAPSTVYSDFVFAKDYSLISFENKMRRTRRLSHLPNMPRTEYINPVSYIMNLEKEVEDLYLYQEQLINRVDEFENIINKLVNNHNKKIRNDNFMNRIFRR